MDTQIFSKLLQTNCALKVGFLRFSCVEFHSGLSNHSFSTRSHCNGLINFWLFRPNLQLWNTVQLKCLCYFFLFCNCSYLLSLIICLIKCGCWVLIPYVGDTKDPRRQLSTQLLNIPSQNLHKQFPPSYVIFLSQEYFTNYLFVLKLLIQTITNKYVRQ